MHQNHQGTCPTNWYQIGLADCEKWGETPMQCVDCPPLPFPDALQQLHCDYKSQCKCWGVPAAKCWRIFFLYWIYWICNNSIIHGGWTKTTKWKHMKQLKHKRCQMPIWMKESGYMATVYSCPVVSWIQSIRGEWNGYGGWLAGTQLKNLKKSIRLSISKKPSKLNADPASKGPWWPWKVAYQSYPLGYTWLIYLIYLIYTKEWVHASVGWWCALCKCKNVKFSMWPGTCNNTGGWVASIALAWVNSRCQLYQQLSTFKNFANQIVLKG